MQNEMRGLLGLMVANAEWSDDHKRLWPSQRRRERTQQAWRSTTSSVDTERICVSKNCDETVWLLFEKSEYERLEERDYIGQWMIGAVHSAWPTHQPCHFSEEMNDGVLIVA